MLGGSLYLELELRENQFGYFLVLTNSLLRTTPNCEAKASWNVGRSYPSNNGNSPNDPIKNVSLLRISRSQHFFNSNFYSFWFHIWDDSLFCTCHEYISIFNIQETESINTVGTRLTPPDSLSSFYPKALRCADFSYATWASVTPSY